MCEPVTIMAAVAIGTTLASSAVAAKSAIDQGNYQSALAKQNAQLAEQGAADALQRGSQEQGVARMKAAQLTGRQEVGLASSNVQTTASAGGLLADSRLMSELDVARIGNNAAREAWGMKVSAVQARAEASAATARAGYGAAGSILGGIGSSAGIAGGAMAKSNPGGIAPGGAGGGDYALQSASAMDYTRLPRRQSGMVGSW